ncbi:MAG TPA: DegQ family serine endoprotease [Rhodopila sp.]|uniref:DegQ family serine endoprotease n=1 Tax=Rhodopila sp. TaxID=2480087 RepID=UPI002C920F34|nr:DegQ family serine endoprotease [Rhodopila sp.]HVY14713.1 DegQ family serine endoprotease [Rhodopila sp.]
MRPYRSSIARAVMLGVSLSLAVPPVALAPLTAVARPAPDSFADLAAKLLPAVVNVSSSQVITARNGVGPEMPIFPPGSPFEQFFKDFLNRNRPGQRGGNDQPPPERRAQSLGSGFIIDPSGYIVTNNHVIEGADEVSVTLQDNTILKAKIVGRDESGDLALLKVDAGKPLPTVSFGDSSTMRVGDWVLAIGNPFGLGGTVTAGIVSARGRDIHQGQYDDFIQTDAAINRGNSGGPLFNMDGQVIGINTAIFSPSGGSIGIGFSIPSDMAKKVISDLREYGHARRGWLGVKIQQVTPDIAESLGLKDAAGAMVAGVTDGGPAERAKIHSGDIILKFDGHDVKEMHNLPRIVGDTDVGKEVPVVLWRDGKEVTVETTLAERPSDEKLAAADQPAQPDNGTRPTDIAGLGMKVAPVSQDLKDKYQLNSDQKGVVITDVAPNTPAAERGLKPGDVIMEVQQNQVASAGDVQKQVEAARKADRKNVLMLIQREGGVQYVPLSLSKVKQPG